MKRVGLSLAVAMAALAPPVHAATFTLTGGQTPFTFWIPDSPAPDVFYKGVSLVIYDVPAPSASGLVDVTFYNEDWFDEEMRSLQIEDYTKNVQLYELFGPQLYSRSEARPTFLGGTYELRDNVGKLYHLTISTDVAAVPELASWAMMITGLGAAGVAARRRPKITMSHRLSM